MHSMTAVNVAELVRRGVVIPRPDLVHIASDVDPSRIESGAVLLPFVRLEGARSAVGRGAKIGSGGPVYLRDCAAGRNVDLASGTFEDAVFLDGAAFGPSGHARAGTLFEEGAKAAHACGVKQTILLPFATLGSLINFCDCLLAGGTGSEDHSEVGSGFIHFNFSPSGAHGDKATPSMFGDVVRGVFLRERRIFLGGDAGVVGPTTVGFGTVLAAGTTYRKDRGEDRLVYAERLPDRERPFDPIVFRNAKEKIHKNVAYLAQLAALRCFYVEVRAALALGDAFATLLVQAAIEVLDVAARERVRQLERLGPDFIRSAEKLRSEGAEAGSPEVAYQIAFAARIATARPALIDLASAANATADGAESAAFAAAAARPPGGYLDWVRGLSDTGFGAGRARLAAAADAYLRQVGPMLGV